MESVLAVYTGHCRIRQQYLNARIRGSEATFKLTGQNKLLSRRHACMVVTEDIDTA